MTKYTKASAHRLAVPGCCFVAGVLLTLLWTSSFNPKLQAPAGEPVVSASADAFNKVAEALSTSTQTLIHNNATQSGSLTIDDLLIAIPSSLGRSAACIKHDYIVAMQASVAVMCMVMCYCWHAFAIPLESWVITMQSQFTPRQEQAYQLATADCRLSLSSLYCEDLTHACMQAASCRS